MLVVFAEQAERDLAEIADYVASNDGVDAAIRVIGRIETAANLLSVSPRRGRRPPELLAEGRMEFREIVVSPYRIVYEVVDRSVTILLVADGRRNMQTLLKRRLLSTD